jgi:hypothetical protein
LAAGAQKRALVLAPAVVVVVVLGGIGVRSCTDGPGGQSLVAAGSAGDGGGDTDDGGGDGGDSGGAGEAGPRGSGKDGVAEQTTSTTAAGSGTTVAGRTTTTAGRGGATTSGPGTGPGGSEPGGTTTTGPPADTTPPAITNLFRSDGQIAPGNFARYCLDPTTTSILSATVTDDGGVGSVVAHWSTDRPSGSIPMEPDGQGNYAGTLGPVEDGGPFPLPVTWYVEATDLAGNRATVTAGGRGAVVIDCVPILN